MRAVKVKKIRKLIYKKGHHPGIIQYFRREAEFGLAIVADKFRQQYQQAKKRYLRGELAL